MGKMLPFTARSNHKEMNQKIADEMAERIMFREVLQQMYEETGIDWLKVCTGDPHENIRLNTRLAAEAAAAGQEKIKDYAGEDYDEEDSI